MPHAEETALTPVFFVSHGSPFMAWRETDSKKAWQEFGQSALNANIKGVVFVGAHWEELGDKIRVATKPNPKMLQMNIIPEEIYKNYPINVSKPLAQKVIKLLQSKGFTDVDEDPTFDWHDDAIISSIGMFPKGTPPATVVSMNGRYDVAFHVKLGRALAELRKENYLVVCTGGAVHNLYRNNWMGIIRRNDNLQIGSVPAKWATDFAQAVGDVIHLNSGPSLAGALMKLRQSPGYKDAHPTDDHYFPLIVAAGLVYDSGETGKRVARTWELTHMCDDQFMWGTWPERQ